MVWIGTSLAATAFVSVAAWVAYHLRTGACGADATAAHRRVAGGYYKPMSRLLADDLAPLRISAHFTATQIEQLRASRRRAFRGYLADLEADFRTLHAEARQMLRDSEEAQPELAMELLKVQAAFQLSLLSAKGCLAAHALGVGLPDQTSVVGPAEWMRQQVELLRAPEFAMDSY